MPDRYVKGERVRIYYESKRLATGLTDVKIDIVKTDGNKEIDQATLSELSSTNAPGVYYYDWVPTNAGTYLVYVDSLTDDYKRTMISQLDIMGRSSKYTQVMGVHGGMSTNRVTVRDTWTEKEKNDLLNTIDKLSTRLDLMSASIDGLGINVGNQNTRIIKLREENEKTKDVLKLSQIEVMERINSKLSQLDTQIEMNMARQTVGANQTNLNFKNIGNEINLFKENNDKLKLDIQGQINPLKEQYINLLDNFSILKMKFNELSDDIEESQQLKTKVLTARNNLLEHKRMMRELEKSLTGSEDMFEQKKVTEPEVFSIEEKIDGISVSVHKDDKVMIYSENKEDITSSYPSLIEEINKLSDSSFILDGELIIGENGVKLKVRDLLYYDEPIYSLALKERLKYLDNLKFNEIIINADRKIVEKENMKKEIELMSGDSKAVIIKSLGEPYSFEDNSIKCFKPGKE